MIGKGLFLCGCDPNDPHVKNYKMDIVQVNGQPVLTGKRYDKSGREICPIHGKALYGCESFLKTGPQGNEIHNYGAEYKARYRGGPVQISSTVPDCRDNRDPADVGSEFLSRREAERAAVAATSNGHALPAGAEG